MPTASEIMKSLGISVTELSGTLRQIKETDPTFKAENVGGGLGSFTKEQYDRIKLEVGVYRESNTMYNFFLNELKILKQEKQKEIEELDKKYELREKNLFDVTAKKWQREYPDLSPVQQAEQILDAAKRVAKGSVASSARITPQGKVQLANRVLALLGSHKEKFYKAQEIFQTIPDVKPHWESVKKFLLSRNLMEHDERDRNERGYRHNQKGLFE